MTDDICQITTEVQQLLMQDDFDGAQDAIRNFCEKRNSQLRSQITLLRSQLAEVTNRFYQYDEDYVPYPDDDYRD